jgi:HSP20 family protein
MMPEQEIVTKEKQQVQGTEQTRPGRYFMPDVDICENDDGLRLWADMPGVLEKDVDVVLKNGVLTITGTVSTASYEKLAPLYTEYNIGNYIRQLD